MGQGERGERGVRGARSVVQTTIQEGARASENKIQKVSTPPDGEGIRRESVGMPKAQGMRARESSDSLHSTSTG